MLPLQTFAVKLCFTEQLKNSLRLRRRSPLYLVDIHRQGLDLYKATVPDPCLVKRVGDDLFDLVRSKDRKPFVGDGSKIIS
jgi:hypothetical protein